MFEKLVVSAQQRRKQRTAKFFFGTLTIYVFAAASAFALSVLVSDPKLADTESIVMLPRLPIAAAQEQRTNTEIQKPSAVAARKDPEHVMRFEDVVNRQPQMPNAYRIFGDSNPS